MSGREGAYANAFLLDGETQLNESSLINVIRWSLCGKKEHVKRAENVTFLEALVDGRSVVVVVVVVVACCLLSLVLAAFGVHVLVHAEESSAEVRLAASGLVTTGEKSIKKGAELNKVLFCFVCLFDFFGLPATFLLDGEVVREREKGERQRARRTKRCWNVQPLNMSVVCVCFEVCVYVFLTLCLPLCVCVCSLSLSLSGVCVCALCVCVCSLSLSYSLNLYSTITIILET